MFISTLYVEPCIKERINTLSNDFHMNSILHICQEGLPNILYIKTVVTNSKKMRYRSVCVRKYLDIFTIRSSIRYTL